MFRFLCELLSEMSKFVDVYGGFGDDVDEKK